MRHKRGSTWLFDGVYRREAHTPVGTPGNLGRDRNRDSINISQRHNVSYGLSGFFFRFMKIMILS